MVIAVIFLSIASMTQTVWIILAHNKINQIVARVNRQDVLRKKG